MDRFAFHLLVYIVSFFVVWGGAGLVVSSVSSLAKSLRLPAFTISFFLLGLLTSLPEFTVGTISVLDGQPIIIAGALLGGVVVIFLGIIPLLGLIGKGIKIPHALSQSEILATVLVVVVPSMLTFDRKITVTEGWLMFFTYVALFAFFALKRSMFNKIASSVKKNKGKEGVYLLKIIVGVVLLLVASRQIVSTTQYFAFVLQISPFFISLIIVALGTNIPELSLVFRSLVTKKNDIALADYLGSASANTLLMGIFSVMYGETLFLPNHFLQRFIFIATGLVLFVFFARSKHVLSRAESAVLFAMYCAFLLFEVVIVSTSL